MQAFVDYLAAQSRAAAVGVDVKLEQALTQLDKMMEDLARELQVEHYGPEIGMNAGRHVYRLVVRAHEWEIHNPSWSLKVCTALPHAGWRADWAVQGVSRLRKPLIVKALPAFFAGYAQAVGDAGKGETKAGQRVAELARAFAVG